MTARCGKAKRKAAVFLLVFVLLISVTPSASARMPHKPRKLPITPPIQYTDLEINTITNIVNGEVGGIIGSVAITYADGSTEYTDGRFLRMIHARVVHNQIQSSLFPDTPSACAARYWSESYAGSELRSSERWKSCREDVVFSLHWLSCIPDNVFAATCDPYFAERYQGYRLWAKVRWDTGYVSGTFYYYAYTQK